MTSNSHEIFSADTPLTDPALDKLGYASFAEGLAASIQRISSKDGYVIAINGEWGLGKSTVLGFLLHYLDHSNIDQQPLMIQFSPWMFTGSEDLVRRFCDQLLDALMSDAKWRSVALAIKRPLARFADAVSETPIIGQYGKAAAKAFNQQKDIHALKAFISDELIKANKRIVVTIDDIDRLSADEMQVLFRVVKAIANFPNIIYILAFDKSVVSKALTSPAVSGADYLEKIVQASFEMPVPNKTRLNEMLVEGLNKLLTDGQQALVDNARWQFISFKGINTFLTTPRHVIRLLNTLVVTLAMVADEVNPLDFICLETLRLFCPDAYQVIRSNKDEFIGTGFSSSFGNSSREKRKDFHNGWIETIPVPHQEAVKRIIVCLFPDLGGIFEGVFSNQHDDRSRRKQLRICVSERFDVYFGFMLPSGLLSNVEVKALLAKLTDEKALTDNLQQIIAGDKQDGSLRLRSYLDELGEHVSDIDVDNIPNVINTIFNIGDEIIGADRKQGIFDTGNDIRLSRIIHWSLLRVPEQIRFTSLHGAIRNGKSLYMSVFEVAMIESYEKSADSVQSAFSYEAFLSSDLVSELVKLMLEKIREAASNETLLAHMEAGRIINRWKDWAGVDEPKRWISSIIVHDLGLIQFLRTGLAAGRIENLETGSVMVSNDFDMNYLHNFLTDLNDVATRVQELSDEEDVPEQQLYLLKAFSRAYERWQASNKRNVGNEEGNQSEN